jgi:methionine-rich copper-binding protein CopC
MPMMVTPAGEAAEYSIPLPDLESGAYTVNWRAEVAGRQHRGSFAFRVSD